MDNQDESRGPMKTPEDVPYKEQTANLLQIVSLSFNLVDEDDPFFCLMKDSPCFRIPRSVIIHGFPGTGKKFLVHKIMHLAKDFLKEKKNITIISITISPKDFDSKNYGGNEQILQRKFKKVLQYSQDPEIYVFLIINSLDFFCPSKKDGLYEGTKRMMSAFIGQLDLLHQNITNSVETTTHLVIIGLTDNISDCDTSILRPGRFDREVELLVPNAMDREKIVKSIFSEFYSSNSENQNENSQKIKEIADRTNGFVAADLKNLIQKANVEMMKASALNQEQDDTKIEENEENTFTKLVSKTIDQIPFTKPSAIREIVVEVPKVFWSDICGQEEAKQALKEAIEWQISHKAKFEKMGIRPPKGILLFGPPGCSKTMMAKALATESSFNFIAVKGPELFSKWVGESEKRVRDVFKKARQSKPTIIFFDEIDGLAVGRSSGSEGSSSVNDRVLSVLLNEMDGIRGLDGVVVVGATNRPDVLDKALLRPGRIDRMVYVGPPNFEARELIFSKFLSSLFEKNKKEIIQKLVFVENNQNFDEKEAELEFRQKFIEKVSVNLAGKTDGYSGAECVALCREGAYIALQESLDSVFVLDSHLENALKTVKTRLTPQLLQFFEDYKKKIMKTV